MAVIQTPNLAQIADPYADDVFNNMWRSAYGFKDTARTDYLKDQYVPAKELGAQLDYLNNRYALQNRANTYDLGLAADFYGAQTQAWGAQDDAALYPTVRGLEDQASVYGATDSMLTQQENVAQRQATIENRATVAEAQTRIASAVGSTPWDQAINAYTSSLDDASATPQVQSALRNNMVDTLQRQLAIMPPGTPEYNNIKQLLITHGGFGVQPANRTAPRFNQPFNAPAPAASPRLSYGAY